MDTLQDVLDRHRVDVLDHLDRELTVPVLSGPQAQGDLLVVPIADADEADRSLFGRCVGKPVAREGAPVLRGEAMGNTHSLHADGDVTWAPYVDGVTLGFASIADGATAWLLHLQHGATGIAPGDYVVHRQREQANEVRLVAD